MVPIGGRFRPIKGLQSSGSVLTSTSNGALTLTFIHLNADVVDAHVVGYGAYRAETYGFTSCLTTSIATLRLCKLVSGRFDGLRNDKTRTVHVVSYLVLMIALVQDV